MLDFSKALNNFSHELLISIFHFDKLVDEPTELK